jgi:hypothetical protein
LWSHGRDDATHTLWDYGWRTFYQLCRIMNFTYYGTE